LEIFVAAAVVDIMVVVTFYDVSVATALVHEVVNATNIDTIVVYKDVVVVLKCVFVNFYGGSIVFTTSILYLLLKML